jgi:hypothetical protein
MGKACVPIVTLTMPMMGTGVSFAHPTISKIDAFLDEVVYHADVTC